MNETNKYKGDDVILRLAEAIAFDLVLDAAKWLFIHGPEVFSALLS